METGVDFLYSRIFAQFYDFEDKKRAGHSTRPRLPEQSDVQLYLKSAFWYSRFSLAMNLTLIPFGHAASHS